MLRRQGRTNDSGETLTPREQLHKLATKVLGPRGKALEHHAGQITWYYPGDVTADPTSDRATTAVLYVPNIERFHSIFATATKPGAPPLVLSADGKVKLMNEFTLIPIGLIVPVPPPATRPGCPGTHRVHVLAYLITDKERGWVYERALTAIESTRLCIPGPDECATPLKYNDRVDGGYEVAAGCHCERPAPVKLFVGDMALAFWNAAHALDGVFLVCSFHDSMNVLEKLDQQFGIKSSTEIFGCFLAFRMMRLCETPRALADRTALLLPALEKMVKEPERGRRFFAFLQKTRYTGEKRYEYTGVARARAVSGTGVLPSALPTTNNCMEREIRAITEGCERLVFPSAVAFLSSLAGLLLTGKPTHSLAEKFANAKQSSSDEAARTASDAKVQWLKACAQVALEGVEQTSTVQLELSDGSVEDCTIVYVRADVFVHPYLTTWEHSGVHFLPHSTAVALQAVFDHHDAQYFPPERPARANCIRVNLEHGVAESSDLTAMIDGVSAAKIAVRMVVDGITPLRAQKALGLFAQHRERTMIDEARHFPDILSMTAEQAGHHVVGAMEVKPAAAPVREKEMFDAWKKRTMGRRRQSLNETADAAPVVVRNKIRRDVRGKGKRKGGGGLARTAAVQAMVTEDLPAGLREFVRRRKAPRPQGASPMLGAAQSHHGTNRLRTARQREAAENTVELANAVSNPSAADGSGPAPKKKRKTWRYNYIVEGIVCQVMCGNQLYLRTRWEGFGSEDDTWQAAPATFSGGASQVEALQRELTNGGHPPPQNASPDTRFRCSHCGDDEVRIKQPW